MLQTVTPTLRKVLLPFVILATAIAMTVGLGAPKAQAETTSTDAVVYVMQVGADSYSQTLDAVLYTEDQIGFMADRILWTESEIGIMADRIVYVTEISLDGTIQVIYLATALWPVGTQDGGYLYDVALTPIAALPL